MGGGGWGEGRRGPRAHLTHGLPALIIVLDDTTCVLSFFGRPYATRRKQHCLSLRSVRRLCRSVLLGVSCTLATSRGNSRIGGLQLSCELVDRKKGR